MAPKDSRLTDVENLLAQVGTLESYANNFQPRGKVALSETKSPPAEVAKAIKMVAELMKAGPSVAASLKTLMGQYKMLQNTGEFGVFAGVLKRENQTLGSVASLAKQYTTLMADKDVEIALSKISISYVGMDNYCKQYVTGYVAFAKDFNKVSKFTDDGKSGVKDAALETLNETLAIGGQMQAMCENFQSRGKVAVAELKTAKKATKDKAQMKEYDAVAAKVETLMKSAGQASAEFKAMMKDFAAAKKDGQFGTCVVKVQSRAAAFRIVQQHGTDLRKALDGASFDHTSTSLHPGLRAVMNYRGHFDAYHKSFKSAIG